MYSGELLNPDESSMAVAIKVVKMRGSERGLLDEVSLMQRATVSCDHVCRLVGVCKARYLILHSPYKSAGTCASHTFLGRGPQIQSQEP